MAHGSRSKPLFDELERLQKMAEYHRAPYPLAMGDGCWLVYERGMGSGPSVHYEFRLEYLGVTIGLSSRADSSRHLSNFYIKIPGESCVIHGAEELRRRIFNFFESFDLDLVDEWIRRIDICLDLSEWNWDDTFAVACEAKQYVGTIRNTAPYRIGQETTGLTAQTGTLKLTIYDKLRETFAKKSEAYQQAMIQTRWGGKVPASATRIEYQIRRGWFADKEGFKTTQGVLDRLADVISHITRFESHPPFVLTSTVPDRKGRHQDRAEVLPDWRRAIEAMRELAGQPRRPVERLNRSMMTAIKSVQNAIGYILTAASQLELVVENVGDLEAVFHELLECNAIDDEVLSLKWSDKARRAGTLRKVTEFPFGANVAI
ncbi:hypothetical protein GC163_22175 [bacterium]|nr:hypothetical protein [bacterium]